MENLYDVVKKLRRECPWDRRQTLLSLSKYLLEETYEVLDSIRHNRMDEVREELGDLLAVLLMMIAIGEEQELFSLDEVVRGIEDKLKRRHPHIFGDKKVSTPDEVKELWEEVKQEEKGVLSVSFSLPALLLAQKVQKRASAMGFDWEDIEGVYDKLAEEVMELKSARDVSEKEEELGDMLFVVAHLANFLGVSAEEALRESTRKFVDRFTKMLKIMESCGVSLKDLSVEEMDVYWEKAKRGE